MGTEHGKEKQESLSGTFAKSIKSTPVTDCHSPQASVIRRSRIVSQVWSRPAYNIQSLDSYCTYYHAKVLRTFFEPDWRLTWQQYLQIYTVPSSRCPLSSSIAVSPRPHLLLPPLRRLGVHDRMSDALV